jgi:hypothetical protein
MRLKSPKVVDTLGIVDKKPAPSLMPAQTSTEADGWDVDFDDDFGTKPKDDWGDFDDDELVPVRLVCHNDVYSPPRA